MQLPYGTVLFISIISPSEASMVCFYIILFFTNLNDAYSGEGHPAVPAITTQFFSMSSPFALGLCKVNDYFL